METRRIVILKFAMSMVFVLSIASSVSIASSESNASQGSLLTNVPKSERELEARRTKLMKLSKSGVQKLIQEAPQVLSLGKGEYSGQVIEVFALLSARPDFDPSLALEMLKTVETIRTATKHETRLALWLTAKAGRLTDERITREFAGVLDVKTASAQRLATLVALTDAMAAAGKTPTLLQLENLVRSDVFEIRMHAVDWFRASPPKAGKDREQFLKVALESKPLQVRERAYRTIASWPSQERDQVKAVLPKNCRNETAPGAVKACTDLLKAMKAGGEK
ncbi:MAG: hypothetical protein RBT63_03455 [Bdellovibrionales bacterium]|jgi:hypothetical protein|nr:hypothetical protein [Bdellovibrionales bacterium]